MTEEREPRTGPRPDCPAVKHDTLNAFVNWHCRCPAGREARRRFEKENRHRRHNGQSRWCSSIGTIRRLRALQALGWGYRDIAPHTGVGWSAVSQWTRRPRVHVETARAVREVYELLSGRPGPSLVTARRARSAGFVPPLAWEGLDIDDPNTEPAEPPVVEDRLWFDQMVVELACLGRAPRELTYGERRAVVGRLHGWGLMDPDIAAISGIPDRRVMGIRRELGLPSNYDAGIANGRMRQEVRRGA